MKILCRLISGILVVGGFLSVLFVTMAMIESMFITWTYTIWLWISVIVTVVGGLWFVYLDDDFEGGE